MKFEITILGCGSATPSLLRNPAAQVVNVQENYFLVDCGEGTQLQLRRHKFKTQRIHHIFISHLHGDHYLGLIGYLQSLHLLGRTHELHLYAHSSLKDLIDLNLKISHSTLGFPLVFHPLRYDQPEIIFENKQVEIKTVILKHRIPCCGFVFREKKKLLSINPDKIKEYGIPVAVLPSVKEGNDYITDSGQVIPNAEITLPVAKSYSYAYCSDTAWSEEVARQLDEPDVLYHESTFTEEHKDRAKETYHSTAREAADIARKCRAGKLILGHFSVRYKTTDDFLLQAKEIFENTELAEDGKVIKLY
ncbi:MAG: ribonuclease Z [Bacteroidota bacterium]